MEAALAFAAIELLSNSPGAHLGWHGDEFVLRRRQVFLRVGIDLLLRLLRRWDGLDQSPPVDHQSHVSLVHVDSRVAHVQPLAGLNQ